jgi:hypothetical protein
MRRVLVLSCLVGVSLAWPAVAGADPVTMTYTGLGSGSWVNIKVGNTVETGWAGEIKWTITSGGVSRAIATYCGDLFDDAKMVQTGNLETTAALDANPSISYGAGPHAGSEAAYLVNTYAGGAAHTSSIDAAALQIAIWQAMFGTSSFTVLNSTANYDAIMRAIGSFTLPSGNFTAVTGYIDIQNGPNAIGSSANGQDQIMIGTPEPAVVVLMVFAMFGLATFYGRSLKPARQRA